MTSMLKRELLEGKIISREVYDRRLSRRILKALTENEFVGPVSFGLGAAGAAVLLGIVARALSLFF
jgi:hypothetical protein